MFEFGAILLYLADKTGKFIAGDLRGRDEALEWLFWQMGGLGPMAGQNNHFANYAVEKFPYAIDRYLNETNRLYGVLNRGLADRQFLAGDYSIADMASYPWVVPYERQGQKIEDFPHLQAWLAAIKARPATVKAYESSLSRSNTAPSIYRRSCARYCSGRPALGRGCGGQGVVVIARSEATKLIQAAIPALDRSASLANDDVLILPDDDLGADRHAVVEIRHVVIDQPEAAGRNGLADGLRRVGAVDAVDGVAEIHGARAERVAGAAGHEARQVWLALDHFRRRPPVRPLGLAA